MIRLSDILNPRDLAQEIEQGYVSSREHKEAPQLTILNYTDCAQFENHWNDVTRATRGLIYNSRTGEVHARGFAKFFNYGDVTNSVAIDPDQHVDDVFEKVDGSLGIAYQDWSLSPSVRIATRGSFHSDQAEHATELLHKNKALVEFVHNMIEAEYTPLFEIIYPENRIVVDYGDTDELVYLGAVSMYRGHFLAPIPWNKNLQGVTVAESHQYRTVREVIESGERTNHEGFVMWLDEFTPVKFKHEQYKSLHRIISNLTTKEVWRQLRDGKFLEYATNLPDEFQPWAVETAGALQSNADDILAEVYSDYRENQHLLGESRKEFAVAIKDLATRPYLFGLADGRDIMPAIWKAVEPVGKETNREQESV